MTASEDVANLRARVEAIEWYHTLELGEGIATAGWFDLRRVAGTLPWPDLRGRRCLDVGTFDGFWAFEMERRGAAEVVAIDLIDPSRWDWPAMPKEEVIAAVGKRKGEGQGFQIAHAALGSNVRRIEMSVYDLDPEMVGRFDVVYVGSLLLHLRDPVLALERVCGVCSGEVLVVDAIDVMLSLMLPKTPLAILDGRQRPWWWKPNIAGLVRMVEAGGFDVVGRPQRVFMPPGRGQQRPRVRPRLLASRLGREALVRAWKGDPHAAVRGKPR